MQQTRSIEMGTGLFVLLGMADGPVAFHFDAPDYAEQLLGRDAE